MINSYKMRKILLKNFQIILLSSILTTLLLIVFICHGDKFVKDKHYIRFDKREAPNATVILQHISHEIPYLPIEDINNNENHKRNINSSCAGYPSLRNIKIHNEYWQEFHHEKVTYYLYGAYLDTRPSVVADVPKVRLLTMMNIIAEKEQDYPLTYCQFWYEEQSEPIIMPASELRLIWYYSWGHNPEDNHAHFLSCSLPKEHKDWLPRTVSLVANPCDKATNNLRVTFKPLKATEVKKGFAVCVKGLDFPYVDLSNRLVEFFETVRLLGAEHVTTYNLQNHPNNTKVLKYYEQIGFLEHRPFSFTLDVGNSPEYRHKEMAENHFAHVKHEVVPYNDCLYRYMYRYQYVAVVDIDEILMPLANFSNWYDLTQFGESIEHNNCKKFASFCFRCIYFPRYPAKPRYTHEFPEYLYMLQHVERVKDHIRPDWATKCLHNTDFVISVHNHFPMATASGVCNAYSFNATHAQMQHYREPDIEETLENPVLDKSLWRYKDDIIRNSMKVFEELNFFEEFNDGH